mmetsp:Transcript_17467/g.28956  ORF Transcript_17467/g.28956 Transcript_17467/m.28956 type:complete len:105 (-) Transcript_17467:273-587(-)
MNEANLNIKRILQELNVHAPALATLVVDLQRLEAQKFRQTVEHQVLQVEQMRRRRKAEDSEDDEVSIHEVQILKGRDALRETDCEIRDLLDAIREHLTELMELE